MQISRNSVFSTKIQTTIANTSCRCDHILEIGLCVSLLPLLVLDRVNKELAGRHGENNDLAKAIRDRLTRFHSEMMDLRDALNEAVNNTARAAEINNANEKTLEDNKVSWKSSWTVKSE